MMVVVRLFVVQSARLLKKEEGPTNKKKIRNERTSETGNVVVVADLCRHPNQLCGAEYNDMCGYPNGICCLVAGRRVCQ